MGCICTKNKGIKPLPKNHQSGVKNQETKKNNISGAAADHDETKQNPVDDKKSLDSNEERQQMFNEQQRLSLIQQDKNQIQQLPSNSKVKGVIEKDDLINEQDEDMFNSKTQQQQQKKQQQNSARYQDIGEIREQEEDEEEGNIGKISEFHKQQDEQVNSVNITTIKKQPTNKIVPVQMTLGKDDAQKYQNQNSMFRESVIKNDQIQYAVISKKNTADLFQSQNSQNQGLQSQIRYKNQSSNLMIQEDILMNPIQTKDNDQFSECEEKSQYSNFQVPKVENTKNNGEMFQQNDSIFEGGDLNLNKKKESEKQFDNKSGGSFDDVFSQSNAGNKKTQQNMNNSFDLNMEKQQEQQQQQQQEDMSFVESDNESGGGIIFVQQTKEGVILKQMTIGDDIQDKNIDMNDENNNNINEKQEGNQQEQEVNQKDVELQNQSPREDNIQEQDEQVQNQQYFSSNEKSKFDRSSQKSMKKNSSHYIQKDDTEQVEPHKGDNSNNNEQIQ